MLAFELRPSLLEAVNLFFARIFATKNCRLGSQKFTGFPLSSRLLIDCPDSWPELLIKLNFAVDWSQGLAKLTKGIRDELSRQALHHLVVGLMESFLFFLLVTPARLERFPVARTLLVDLICNFVQLRLKGPPNFKDFVGISWIYSIESPGGYTVPVPSDCSCVNLELIHASSEMVDQDIL